MTSTKWPPVFRAVIAVAGLAIAVATVLGACASTPSTGGPSNDGEPSAGQVTSSSNPGTGGSSAAAGPPGVSSSGQLTVPDSLTGRTFVSIGVSGHDLVAGSALTLTFDGTGTVSMNAGCNTMMGRATVGGAVLRIFQMTSTLIGCEPALMAQDTWVSRLFAKGLALDVHGDTLVLSSDEATITMRDRSAVLPNLPLAETTWRLEGVITGEGVTHFADETATMRIDGSRISYQACNTHSGVVAITADSATTSRMIGTDRACVGDRGEVENAMNSVLNGTFTIAIDGYRLPGDVRRFITSKP